MSSSIRKNGGTCSAVGCTMRRGTNLLSQVKMFAFPRNPVRRKAWEIALRRKNWAPNNHSLICNSHFISGRPSSDPAHPDYVPSIFCFNNKTAIQRGQSKLERFEKRVVHGKTTAERNTAYVIDAAALGNSMGKPTDLKDLDQNWVPSINTGLENKSSKTCLYKTYSKKDIPCLNDDGKSSKQMNTLIHQNTSTSIPETSSSQNIEKTVLNYSDESSENVSAENICTTNTPIIECVFSIKDQVSETDECTQMKDNSDMNLIDQQHLSSIKKELIFQNLLENLTLIKKPNFFWGITSHLSVIICARWSEDYTCEKKVVIDNSLTARAFLKEWEISLLDLTNITCINDISNLLEKVESYKIVKFQE